MGECIDNVFKVLKSNKVCSSKPKLQEKQWLN